MSYEWTRQEEGDSGRWQVLEKTEHATDRKLLAEGLDEVQARNISITHNVAPQRAWLAVPRQARVTKWGLWVEGGFGFRRFCSGMDPETARTLADAHNAGREAQP